MLTFVLSSFKIGSFFLSKDRLPNTLKSYDIYKFTCVGCQFRYVNKTSSININKDEGVFEN